MAYNEARMRELILYFARAQQDDDTFGRVKLAKLLYYADMEAYIRLGAPITGATYMKRREGPAAREFVPLRDRMLALGEAAEVEIAYPNGYVGKKLEARRDTDLSVFTAQEREIIDAVTEEYRGWSATRISQKSHDEVGWLTVAMDDAIPYQRYYVAPKMTEEELVAAEAVVRTLNLRVPANVA
ncbi:MAG TPA: Panacea domain-containing protein [Verrucomicrobiae bacterium]|nr:Panacea domain-containing protein [Verrucomicrobiae bacterium]